uniref:Legumin; 11S globulin n=1 Tax=Ephedra gerardiana TaxID=42328 RepID=Q39722_EPHGE|nr:legumin; 11S globulin [Ephedra gerardiana]
MARARSWMFVFLSLALLLTCSAYRGLHQQQSRDNDNNNPCLNLISQNIRARDPAESSSIQAKSEGGRFEVTTPNDAPELECARVAFNREVISENSLARPRYTNVPLVAYVVKGEGYFSIVFPGCPNTIEDPFEEIRGGRQPRREPHHQPGRQDERGQGQQQQEGEDEQYEHDTAQKIHRVKRGDAIAIPAGHVFWIYNNRNEDLEIVSVADLANHQNQLDEEYLTFLLNGNAPVLPQQQEGRRRGRDESGRRGGEGQDASGILSGFSSDRLARALGIRNCTASRLQGKEQQQQRGLHVKVNFQNPSRDALYVAENAGNGFPSETVCNQRIRHNINRRDQPDFYHPRAGFMSVANSFKLPILDNIRLSADHVNLQPNAIFGPSWVVNAHRVIYALQGSGNVEIVAPNGEGVFQGRLRRGQFLVIPQFFAAVKEASEEGFEWVAFLTHQRPYRSDLSGAGSVFVGLPRPVVEEAFGLEEEEARALDRNLRRRANTPFSPPRSGSQVDYECPRQGDQDRDQPGFQLH